MMVLATAYIAIGAAGGFILAAFLLILSIGGF